MVVRLGIVFVVLGALWILGAINLDNLPWDSQEFRVSSAAVVCYLFWSASESRSKTGGGSYSTPYAVFYIVLLVSAVDSFLLRLTAYGPPWPLRWAGLVLFAAGSVVRLVAFRNRSSGLLRTGRLLQLAGLPVALGSIAGSATALLAGVPSALQETLEPVEEVESSDGINSVEER